MMPSQKSGIEMPSRPDGQRRRDRRRRRAGRRQQAERHADQRGAQRGEQRQLERDGQAIEDHAADRLVLAEVDAEVAAQRRPPSQREYCVEQRLVEVEGLAQGADALGRGLVAEDGDRGIARHQPHEPEDEHAHAEQQRHRQQRAGAPRRPRATTSARPRAQIRRARSLRTCSSSDESGTEPCTFGFIQ